MEQKQMKEICLGIISYIAVAILLVYGAYNEWKDGNKVIAIITGFVAIMMVWNAYDNYKELNNKPA